MKRYEYRIADICERIHMSCRGSGDPLSADQLAYYAAVLADRLRTWSEPTSLYDEAYRLLIIATLAEAKEYHE